MHMHANKLMRYARLPVPVASCQGAQGVEGQARESAAEEEGWPTEKAHARNSAVERLI